MPLKTPSWPNTTSKLCFRCLRRAQNAYQIHRSLHTSPIRFAAPTIPSQAAQGGDILLTNRAFILLEGPDAPKFLQGLTTNNVDTNKINPWYTGFLEAHGRVLWDAFIYPRNTAFDNPWSCYIEVDEATSDAFVKHLSRHKLRSKVQIRKVLDQGVWAHFGDTTSSAPKGSIHDDPRLPALGSRSLGPNLAQSSQAAPQQYRLHRYLHGVAEGPQEIIPSSALPQESNFDFLNGIDFRKGCYLGQELTIRTQHTGVVRKRILPVKLYASSQSPPATLEYAPGSFEIQPGADIKRVTTEGGGSSKRSAGKMLGNVGNLGLALCRLEMMTDLRVSAEGGSYKEGQEFCVGGDEGVRVKAFVPDWLRTKLDEERERKGID